MVGVFYEITREHGLRVLLATLGACGIEEEEIAAVLEDLKLALSKGCMRLVIEPTPLKRGTCRIVTADDRSVLVLDPSCVTSHVPILTGTPPVKIEFTSPTQP